MPHPYPRRRVVPIVTAAPASSPAIERSAIGILCGSGTQSPAPARQAGSVVTKPRTSPITPPIAAPVPIRTNLSIEIILGAGAKCPRGSRALRRLRGNRFSTRRSCALAFGRLAPLLTATGEHKENPGS